MGIKNKRGRKEGATKKCNKKPSFFLIKRGWYSSLWSDSWLIIYFEKHRERQIVLQKKGPSKTRKKSGRCFKGKNTLCGFWEQFFSNAFIYCLIGIRQTANLCLTYHAYRAYTIYTTGTTCTMHTVRNSCTQHTTTTFVLRVLRAHTIRTWNTTRTIRTLFTTCTKSYHSYYAYFAISRTTLSILTARTTDHGS